MQFSDARNLSSNQFAFGCLRLQVEFVFIPPLGSWSHPKVILGLSLKKKKDCLIIWEFCQKGCWLNLISSIYCITDLWCIIPKNIYIYRNQITSGINTHKKTKHALFRRKNVAICRSLTQKCIKNASPSAEVPGVLQELSRNHRHCGDFNTEATLRHGQMSQVYVVSQKSHGIDWGCKSVWVFLGGRIKGTDLC